MTTNIPDWLGATTGQQTNAGLIDQFLGTHEAVFIYAGETVQDSQAIGTGVYTSTASTYLAQPFTTSSTQTTASRVNLQISAVGGSPLSATIPPLTVSIYAASLGFPTGSPLATAVIAEQTVYSAPFWLPVTLYVTGITASTTYMIVVEQAGSGGSYYVWQQSNQLSGALTSPDGVNWTPQGYGFMYQSYDGGGGTPPILSIIEDSGNRTTNFTYNSLLQLTGITEQTVTQSGGVLVSSRTLTYSGNNLIGVS